METTTKFTTIRQRCICILIVLQLVLICAVSCQNAVNVADEEKTATLTISTDNSVYFVQPLLSSWLGTDVSFTLRGTKNGEAKVLKTWKANGNTAAYPLMISDTMLCGDTGTWDFILDVRKNSVVVLTGIIDGQEICSGFNMLKFKAFTETATVNGDVNVTLYFPSSSDAASVKAGLYTLEGNSIATYVDEVLTVITGIDDYTGMSGVTYCKTKVAKGTYLLKFSLYNNENSLMNTYVEMVGVAPGCTSLAICTLPNLNNLYTVTYNLVSDDANWVGCFTAPVTFSADMTVTLPVATNVIRFGYKFGGWYDNATFDGTPLIGWNSGAKNAPVTLYAKWDIMKDDIVFLESFKFSQNHNSDLPNDLSEARVITPEINDIEYTTLSWIENIRSLIPSFSAEGIVYANGIEIQSGSTPLDFSKPVQLVVVKETGSKEYEITLNCPQTTGLPVIRIHTKNAVPIDSKETYVPANIQVMDYSNSENNYITTEFSGEYADKIRGRGNATWNYEKKPYKIKLNKKINFLNIGNDKCKDWALLANYCDKTLLRTAVGFWVSEKMELAWTPDSRFVDLFINDEYLGTYQLCESVSVSEGRINIPEKTGYLIEHSRLYEQESKYFVTSQYEFGYFFKHPDADELTNNQREKIINFMNSFETSLAGDGFVDSEKNSYRKYIDSESFAKWFIVHNILANIDMNFYYYINSIETGKLEIGPVWDFEWSIGIGWYYSTRPRPANYWCAKTKYFIRLLQDPEFISVLQAVWNSYKATIQNGIYDYMNQIASEIKDSRNLNFKRWDIMDTVVSVGGNPMGSYEAELACDIQFLQNRFLWLDAEIQALSEN